MKMFCASEVDVVSSLSSHHSAPVPGAGCLIVLKLTLQRVKTLKCFKFLVHATLPVSFHAAHLSLCTWHASCDPHMFRFKLKKETHARLSLAAGWLTAQFITLFTRYEAPLPPWSLWKSCVSHPAPGCVLNTAGGRTDNLQSARHVHQGFWFFLFLQKWFKTSAVNPFNGCSAVFKLSMVGFL